VPLYFVLLTALFLSAEFLAGLAFVRRRSLHLGSILSFDALFFVFLPLLAAGQAYRRLRKYLLDLGTGPEAGLPIWTSLLQVLLLAYTAMVLLACMVLEALLRYRR